MITSRQGAIWPSGPPSVLVTRSMTRFSSPNLETGGFSPFEGLEFHGRKMDPRSRNRRGLSCCSRCFRCFVAICAEEFNSLQDDLSVSVTGCDTGVGIKILASGTADIAMASREVKAEEVVIYGDRFVPFPMAIGKGRERRVLSPGKDPLTCTPWASPTMTRGRLLSSSQENGARPSPRS